MREKVILVCEECLSRNYTTEKNKLNTTERVVIKKFCKKCNKHTVHKETKQEDAIMLKWFSFSGVTKEIKKIRWPKREDLVENSVQTIIFTFWDTLS